jgi:ABC-type Fe3+-hydroxamate transport system substrate-binding protein
LSGGALARPEPDRIVSLVPSLTEALFELGLGERLVGVTDWCVHPADAVAQLPRVGGTKNPDLDRIEALAPNLVIANHEENTRRDVERLRGLGFEVWVTYPRTVRDGAVLLRELAGLGASDDAIRAVVEPVEAAVTSLDTDPPVGRTRVFCPIWKDPWMAVGGDTYAGDLLSACGGDNVFADRDDRRYPKVRETDILETAPEVILLPDEPYRFGSEDASELAALDLPASRNGRIHLIDGTLVSWYGPRIRTAIDTLRTLLDLSDDASDRGFR